jgi:hypothetical protein
VKIQVMCFFYPHKENSMSYPRSIFEPLIEDGERIINQLMTQVDAVQASIERVKRARQMARECQEQLEMAEAEHVAAALALAETGSGPLQGIAKTSKAYQFALDNMLAQARQHSLRMEAEAAQTAQMELVNAEIVYDQEMARFSALRHAADLLASMIHGTRV